MLVDFLLQEGFQNITVLDISAAAIDKEKARLGEKAINRRLQHRCITGDRKHLLGMQRTRKRPQTSPRSARQNDWEDGGQRYVHQQPLTAVAAAVNTSACLR